MNNMQAPSLLVAAGEKEIDTTRNQVGSSIRTGKNRGLASSDDDNAIVPGRGWETHGWKVTTGFCDGSAMSTCGRMRNDNCLMTGANDNHLDVAGNALSGWLVFTVPKVKEGVILARMEWWCHYAHKLTTDWTEVNDGKTTDTTPYNATVGQRQLGKPTQDQLVPKDLEMDIAINGKITKTMKRDDWIKYTAEKTKNCAVWPLLNNEEMSKRDWKDDNEGETVDVAVRFRSKENPKATFCISHIYYA